MEEKFYTSTEAAEITNCTRRQLQYWREKGVVVPTVNTAGKGRNVYYSVADLLALTVMEYLLFIGLSFEVCRETLEVLKEQEPWFFEQPLKQGQARRFMLTPGLAQQRLKLLAFDKEKAFEAICNGKAVIPFWLNDVYQRLKENLQKSGC